MCGVSGRIYYRCKPSKRRMPIGKRHVTASLLSDAIQLQNRGQQATGFVVGFSYLEQPYVPWKKIGSASALFGKDSEAKADTLIKRYKGNLGIVHVRYTTAGESSNEAAQPHGFKHGGRSVVIASNGDIPLYTKLRRRIVRQYGCRFASKCDAELIVNLIGVEIFEKGMDEIAAFAQVGSTLEGAFSLVGMTPSGKLVGMRDPWGFRPMFWARNEDGAMICSESSVMASEFDEVHEVEPGTLIVISDNGEEDVSIQRFAPAQPSFCLMEIYYFSQPNSKYKGVSFDELRYRLGEETAREWFASGKPIPDIVAAMPFSGGPAAQGFIEGIRKEANTRGRNVVYKNRHGLGRAFMSKLSDRADRIRANLDIIPEPVHGKAILLVDDSIVRADQARWVCPELRNRGARAVYYAVTAPPYRFPCFFGLNTPESKLLIAHGRTEAEILEAVPGLDVLHYLSLEGSMRVLGDQGFCTACFTGKYPMPVPNNKREIV